LRSRFGLDPLLSQFETRRPMNSRHQISGAAIALIKRFEGYREKSARLHDGRWTIGYGHTLTAREGARVDEPDAEALLQYDLIAVAHAVNEWTYAPLTQNQFDALVSFAFNVGVENFRHSTTLRRLNEGRMLEAGMAMELWRRADFEGERIVVDALVRRRSCEKTLFLKPVDAWPAAPTPILPPKLDYDTDLVMPSQTPTVVRADLDGDRAVATRESAPIEVPTPPAPVIAPSATETAAAAVAARLEGLFPEGDLDPEGGANRLPGVAATPISHPVPIPPEPSLFDKPLSGAAIPAAAPGPAIDWQSTARRSSSGTSWLFALAILGVAMFLAAVLWGFKTPGIGPLLGWGLGGLGIASVAVAAYLLLARLPDRDSSGGD